MEETEFLFTWTEICKRVEVWNKENPKSNFLENPALEFALYLIEGARELDNDALGLGKKYISGHDLVHGKNKTSGDPLIDRKRELEA